MKYLLSLFAVLACLSASAQKEKTVKLNDTTKLTYAVADNGRTKDGVYYIKNTVNDGLWVQGNYKQDARFGSWYFFDANDKKLVMRYNYDQKKLYYFDKDQLKNVSVRVLTTDEDVAKKASAPLPLCPVNYLLTVLVNRIYTDMNLGDGSIQAEITAHVDSTGKASYTLVYNDPNKEKPKSDDGSTEVAPVKQWKIKLDDNLFAIEWLPSSYNNKGLNSNFTIYALISPKTQPHFQRFRWDQ
ncbi:MAG: hypothetical protein JWQ66_3321 [Mucilaginibacter sp.]|nr:hypothetical protein [Mucilaginibacter sp.]